jgi:hypothetical protein
MQVNVSLCLINYALCREDVWSSGGRDPLFLTSAIVGGEWSASIPGSFIPGTCWIGGWVGPSGGLDAMGKRKLFPHPGTNQER